MAQRLREVSYKYDPEMSFNGFRIEDGSSVWTD